MSLPWLHPARAAALQAALHQSILIIDGAMGTMIQRHELTETDYRGARFAEGYDALFAHSGHTHGPGCGCEGPVSYTHLDVYKRQTWHRCTSVGSPGGAFES